MNQAFYKLWKLFLLLLAGHTPYALSASATGSMTVSATVVATCSVSTTAVLFGNYDPSPSNTTALLQPGSIELTCTQGTTITNITLSAGSHGGTVAAYDRAMDNAGNKIGYDLYQPDSTVTSAPCTTYATKWNPDNVFTPAPAPSNSPRTYYVCGKTLNGQNVPPGSYTDTVTVTVVY